MGTPTDGLPKITYSVPEAAEVLGISEWLLRRLIARGEIPARRYGERRLLISCEVLHELVRQSNTAQAS